MKLLIIFLATALFALRANAQPVVVTVGDTIFIRSIQLPYDPNGCNGCGTPDGLMSQRKSSSPNSSFFQYEPSTHTVGQLDIFVSATIAGKFFDTSTLTATYGCFCQHQYTFSLTSTHIDSAIVVADSQLRIRPKSWTTWLFYDSTNGGWKASLKPIFLNDTSSDAILDSFSLELDTETAKHLQMSVTDSGIPITSKVLRANSSDSEIEFKIAYMPINYQPINTSLRTFVHVGGYDSVYSNPFQMGFRIPGFQDQTIIPTDTIRLIAHSGIGSKQYLRIRCDPSLSSITFSKLYYPFSTKVVDSTRDSVLLEIELAKVTGGFYRDRLSIDYAVTEFGISHKNGASIFITADVDTLSERLAWKNLSFKNTINPNATLFSGNTLYAYGPGVYRLQRNATEWETLLDSFQLITRLIKNNAGHFMAIGKDWLLSTDDGLNWKKVVFDTFGSVYFTSNQPPYGTAGGPLQTAGPQYGPDGFLYQAGNLNAWVADINHNPIGISRSRVAWADDTGGKWHSVVDIYGLGENPLQGMLVDSSHIYVSPNNARNNPIFRAKPPGDRISFYPDSGYFSGNYGGGVSTSKGVTGLPLTSIQATAIDPNGTLYAATHDGVFESTDSGHTWQGRNAGLTTRNVINIVIDPFLYTYLFTDSGWFRSVSSYANVANDGTLTRTLKLFPNPTNGHAQLISPARILEVMLDDCTGREVARYTTQDETVSYDLNTQLLPAGIYFVLVRTSSGIETARLCVAR